MRAILTYHSIDRSGSVISTAPEVFRAHVEWLATGAVQVVSLTEILSLADDRNAVALTFDDGFANVATDAAPLLAAHGFVATVFVVSRHVGGDNRWNGAGDAGIPILPVLDWRGLEALRARGFSVGAHTRNHRHLHHCAHDELAEELGGSADDIQRALGERPTTFAYPYGDVNTRVARAAAAAFATSCTTDFQELRRGVSRERVPRLDAWYFRDPAMLRRWGTRRFRAAIRTRHALRRLRRVFR